MLNKKCFGAVLLAAATVSTTAMADDRGANIFVGALAGAALGHAAGGRDGAIVGGVLGAAVGNSIQTRDDRYYQGGATYYSQPAYVESAPVYYDAPTTVVYERPAPVYYEAPRYYSEPVVVVGGRGHWEHRGHYEHGGRWHR